MRAALGREPEMIRVCVREDGKKRSMARGVMRKRGIAAPLAFATAVFWMAAAAAATGGEAGVWRMTLDDTNRACSMVLRDDPTADAQSRTLAMPAGCRRALPILMDVTAWRQSDDGLALLDQTGAPVLRFAAAGPRGYLARGPEGETYALQTDASAPVQMAQANGAKPRPPAAAAAPAARVTEVAGRYAVLRDEGRDTGCMVTLFETARGRGTYRALLAPACRDQGIVIFDPQAWTIDRGKLSLTARKGHKLLLEPAGDGVWWFKDKRNLGLRKI